MTCQTHHHAWDCREQRIAVLNKAALDAASELDALSGRFRDQIDEHDYDQIKLAVARIYDASEQLQPLPEIDPATPPSMAQIAARLDALAAEMLQVATLMDYYGGLSAIGAHGIELAGAAHIARGWAQGMREDGHA